VAIYAPASSGLLRGYAPRNRGSFGVATAAIGRWKTPCGLLDGSFDEDASGICKDEGSANLPCMRRLPLTQLKRESSLKVGVKNKRSRAD